MGAGDEVVTLQVGEAHVFDAEAVHAIDHVEDAVVFVTVAVGLVDQGADLPDGQFHATA
ncbi:hypothetical protein D3C76_577980 [compost metagenome]